jgi:hypothetical protein
MDFMDYTQVQTSSIQTFALTEINRLGLRVAASTQDTNPGFGEVGCDTQSASGSDSSNSDGIYLEKRVVDGRVQTICLKTCERCNTTIC